MRGIKIKYIIIPIDSLCSGSYEDIDKLVDLGIDLESIMLMALNTYNEVSVRGTDLFGNAIDPITILTENAVNGISEANGLFNFERRVYERKIFELTSIFYFYIENIIATSMIAKPSDLSFNRWIDNNDALVEYVNI